MQTENQTKDQSETGNDGAPFTTSGLALLALRGVAPPGLTEVALRDRLTAAGVTQIGRSALYAALADLVDRGLATREAIGRHDRRKPCYAWHLTPRGDDIAAGTARAGVRVLSASFVGTVEAHARRVLSLRTELKASEEALAKRINFREKVLLEEGSFTVVPGAMKASKALEEVLRGLKLYEQASVEKREVVMAKVDELAADHPDLGAWVDARRAELAGERHLRFSARKGAVTP